VAQNINIAINGSSRELSTATPPFLRILAGWWRVAHKFTENFTMGIFTALKMANTAADFLALSSLSKALHNERYPMYRKNKINIEVSLASHTHQVPQVPFPQMLPVIKHIAEKTVPAGAAAWAKTLAMLLFHTKEVKLSAAINPYIPRESHAEGT